ncbi:Ribokinase-like protein [Ascobolus immersus RN42]|uniref:Ribokinase-like protein n=1 Tax=Ascobolus immersus RN42 TaxID=1160509 RepID=A0A3N4HLN3_ASCIM|nr:Ribokinase-like protein [Ascobolus immersus RN42]
MIKAILGARLFSPDELSRRCGWIVDAGEDFPAALREEVERCEMRTVVRRREGRTTRGWNSYVEGERAFKYLSPKLRLEPKDLHQTGLYPFKSIHIICSPTRLRHILDEMTHLFPEQDPIIVFEPVPDCCTPETLPELIELLPRIHVLSPNASELLAFFGHSRKLADQDEGEVSDTISAEYKSTVESLASDLAEKSGGKTNIVIRCGALGSFHIPASSSSAASSSGAGKWFPAYHGSQEKVLDPTGAGNAFCGAMAVGLTRGVGIDEAVCWGNVAAGFVVEQTGLPVLSEEGGRWNGSDVKGRLVEYKKRALGI